MQKIILATVADAELNLVYARFQMKQPPSNCSLLDIYPVAVADLGFPGDGGAKPLGRGRGNANTQFCQNSPKTL